jgi:anti-anti-sigma factor
MPKPPERHLIRTTHQGILVLTFTEAQLHGDRLLTALHHELDEATAAPETKRVVLDFQHVRALSSAAFRPLLRLRRRLEDKGGQLALCNLAPVVAESFRATRLLGIGQGALATAFAVQPDVGAAVASLRSPEGEA